MNIAEEKCGAKIRSQCPRHGNHPNGLSSMLKEVKEQLKQVESSYKNLASYLQPAKIKRVGHNDDPEHEVHKQLDEEARKFRKSIDEKIFRGVQAYTLGGFEWVNSYLRSQEIFDKYIAERFSSFESKEGIARQHQTYTKYAKDDIEGIDGVFKNAKPAKEPRVLYRGVGLKHPNGKVTPKELHEYVKTLYTKGTIIEEPTYLSTSVDPDYMLAFETNYTPEPTQQIVFEIVTPNGIPLHNPDRSGTLQSAEKEILLNRNSKFRIENIIQTTYESSYPDGRPKYSALNDAPKKKRYTVVQMVEIPQNSVHNK